MVYTVRYSVMEHYIPYVEHKPALDNDTYHHYLVAVKVIFPPPVFG